MEVIAYADYFSLLSFTTSHLQSAQKCGSNFYTKCHKMALSKSQICSILQHSIFDFFQKNMLSLFDTMLNFVVNLLENERDPRQDQ
jgi:hypothetical protein